MKQLDLIAQWNARIQDLESLLREVAAVMMPKALRSELPGAELGLLWSIQVVLQKGERGAAVAAQIQAVLEGN